MEQKNNSMPEMNDIQTFVNDSIMYNLFDTNNNLDNTITQESHDFHNLETGIPDMDHNYLSQLLHAVMESESKKSAVDFVSMSEVERIPVSEINAFNNFRPSSESNFQPDNTNDKEEDKSSMNESNQDLATKSGLNENGINKSRRLWDDEEVSIFLNHFKEDYALYQKNSKKFYEKMASKYFTSRSKGAIQSKLNQLLDKYEEVKSNSAKYNWKWYRIIDDIIKEDSNDANDHDSDRSSEINYYNERLKSKRLVKSKNNKPTDVSEVESHEVIIGNHKINNNNFIKAENNAIDNGAVENRNCISKKRRIGISSACIIADAIKESVMYRERILEHDNKLKELEVKLSQLSQKNNY
ncbi:4807_t:CDS:2 [Entrophospora sp. SA101]|nr:22795_t:CDS:2 [Entrophospora sp. SA101]CAJ0756877.1 20694_t:CDS:2 [Entrophospora sp. SA101]CAJ0767290.1 4807_t:CDS:2 [Entrophospora sp. SA101]